jgi:site-specific recombinase XerD
MEAVEIRRDFAAQGTFNKRVFAQLSGDLDSMKKLRRLDIRMLRRVADQLGREEICEPGCWPEARELSRRLAVCYSGSWKYWHFGCPILKIATDLEKEGRIAPELPFAESIEKVLRRFDPKTRQVVESYLDGYWVTPGSRVKLVVTASRIGALYRFCSGGDLFAVDQAVAQSYVEQLKCKKVSSIHEYRMCLRRFYRWSVKQGLCQNNPFEGWYPKRLTRTCEKCGKTKNFRHNDHLCDQCHAMPVNLAKRDQLIPLIESYLAPSDYNQYLFDLYIRYLKRYVITPKHVVATRALIEFLQSRPLSVIRSWSTIYSLSEELNQRGKSPIPRGDPILKVGRMLEELGILPIRQTDRENLISRLIAGCPEAVAPVLRRYAEHLLKLRQRSRSRYSAIRSIFEVQCWLAKHRPGADLLTANRKDIEQYVSRLGNQDRSGIRRYVLRRFYRWARSEKLVLMNPLDGMVLPKSIRRICVCTDSQIRKIESFVKRQDSEPEHALILTLTLYWGLSVSDLARASLEIHGSQMSIVLHREALSPRRQTHYRDQILKLPLCPTWLAELQKRYLQLWRERFEQVPKDFPVQPLILRKRSNRHLDFRTVMDFYYEAVIAATGNKLPPNVVRRTSAHIHTRYGDASLLAKLGWAQRHCHDFSIYPRTYFSPKPRG